MGKFFAILLLLATASTLSAQNKDSADISALHVNKVCGVADSTLQSRYLQEQRDYENRLDSIWRSDNIWNLGALDLSGRPIDGSKGIELPRWAKWDYDLEKYFLSRMVYPPHLLEENRAGYTVAMFTVDTLGLPRSVNILEGSHKDFDREVIRLIKELPHCLPCRNEDGKRMECLYAVYVPFLPQHYRDRLKADSIAEEELKYVWAEWEVMSYFRYGDRRAAQDYITKRLKYDPRLLGDKQQARGFYTILIDSYGEVYGAKTMRSCGIQDWDNQVLEIIKGMPRWTPTINYYGMGEYRKSAWTVSIFFKKK